MYLILIVLSILLQCHSCLRCYIHHTQSHKTRVNPADLPTDQCPNDTKACITTSFTYHTRLKEDSFGEKANVLTCLNISCVTFNRSERFRQLWFDNLAKSLDQVAVQAIKAMYVCCETDLCNVPNYYRSFEPMIRDNNGTYI